MMQIERICTDVSNGTRNITSSASPSLTSSTDDAYCSDDTLSSDEHIADDVVNEISKPLLDVTSPRKDNVVNSNMPCRCNSTQASTGLFVKNRGINTQANIGLSVNMLNVKAQAVASVNVPKIVRQTPIYLKNYSASAGVHKVLKQGLLSDRFIQTVANSRDAAHQENAQHLSSVHVQLSHPVNLLRYKPYSTNNLCSQQKVGQKNTFSDFVLNGTVRTNEGKLNPPGTPITARKMKMDAPTSATETCYVLKTMRNDSICLNQSAYSLQLLKPSLALSRNLEQQELQSRQNDSVERSVDKTNLSCRTDLNSSSSSQNTLTNLHKILNPNQRNSMEDKTGTRKNDRSSMVELMNKSPVELQDYFVRIHDSHCENPFEKCPIHHNELINRLNILHCQVCKITQSMLLDSKTADHEGCVQSKVSTSTNSAALSRILTPHVPISRTQYGTAHTRKTDVSVKHQAPPLRAISETNQPVEKSHTKGKSLCVQGVGYLLEKKQNPLKKRLTTKSNVPKPRLLQDKNKKFITADIDTTLSQPLDLSSKNGIKTGKKRVLNKKTEEKSKRLKVEKKQSQGPSLQMGFIKFEVLDTVVPSAICTQSLPKPFDALSCNKSLDTPSLTETRSRTSVKFEKNEPIPYAQPAAANLINYGGDLSQQTQDKELSHIKVTSVRHVPENNDSNHHKPAKTEEEIDVSRMESSSSVEDSKLLKMKIGKLLTHVQEKCYERDVDKVKTRRSNRKSALRNVTSDSRIQIHHSRRFNSISSSNALSTAFKNFVTHRSLYNCTVRLVDIFSCDASYEELKCWR